MNDTNLSGNPARESSQSELKTEDLSQIFNYPSIGQLFDQSDPQRFEVFRSRLVTTRENLERVVRYGSRDEADKADRAARAVNITLDFLDSLNKMRTAQK